MKQYFNFNALGKAMKTKRVIELDLGVREVAKKLKVSPATISRMERGYACEINHVMTACNWMNVSLCDFIVKNKN